MIRLDRKEQPEDLLRKATMSALSQIIDPLIGLMIDGGIAVAELNGLIRERSVRVASTRLLREGGRQSKARLAIATGLSRSEVARLLAAKKQVTAPRRRPHPVARVLAVWFEEPRYLAANGEPAILPIFGKRRSFETLVERHGGGIPVRAMLDELTQIDAVQILPNQKVKATSRLPISTGVTIDAISAFGERGRDLLESLISNMRQTDNWLFEATAVVNDADVALVSMIRRDIAMQSTQFISGINSLLKRSRKKVSRSTLAPALIRRLGVTVFYFQDNGSASDAGNTKIIRRKNLRRQKLSSQTRSATSAR